MSKACVNKENFGIRVLGQDLHITLGLRRKFTLHLIRIWQTANLWSGIWDHLICFS